MNPLAFAGAALGGLVAWHEWVAPRLIRLRQRRSRERRAQAVLNEMFREHMRIKSFEGVVGLARMRELEELVDELTRDTRKRR